MRDRLIIIGRSRTEASFSGRCEVWLRQAYDELASSYRFYIFDGKSTETLTVATNEINLSSAMTDMKYIISVRSLFNKRRVKQVSFRSIDNRDYAGTGNPTLYARYGFTLIFDRTADQTYSYDIRYKKLITEPVFSGSARPETPTQWDDIILYRAAEKAYAELFETDRAEYYRSEYTRLIAELPLDEIVESEDGEPAMQPQMYGRSA